MKIKNATDPVGPGTLAWDAFAGFVDALRNNDRRTQDIRRHYLIKCLRKAGSDMVDQWVDRARALALDLSFEP